MREIYVFVFLAVVYAAAIALGSWYVMQAERRRHLQLRMHAALSSAGNWLDSKFACASQKTMQLPERMSSYAQHLKKNLRHHRRAVLLTLAILALPAVMIQLLAPHGALEAYDDLPQITDPVVVALLQGEQLAPPPPLPPELFITREIEAERHEIASASRVWTLLDADFRQRLLTVYQLMAKHGYQMALIEGYRSPERQTLLAKLGAHVTNARAYQSYHQYGLAADSAFYRDGRVVISEKDPWAMEAYRLYGQYAESVGLVWGGRWQMMDLGHVELRKPNVLGGR